MKAASDLSICTSLLHSPSGIPGYPVTLFSEELVREAETRTSVGASPPGRRQCRSLH
jgi:hypothetical protein